MVAVRRLRREHMLPWYAHILSTARLHGTHTLRKTVINLSGYKNGPHAGLAVGGIATHTHGHILTRRHISTASDNKLDGAWE